MLALAFAVLCTTAVVVFLQVFCALAFPFSLLFASIITFLVWITLRPEIAGGVQAVSNGMLRRSRDGALAVRHGRVLTTFCGRMHTAERLSSVDRAHRPARY